MNLLYNELIELGWTPAQVSYYYPYLEPGVDYTPEAYQEAVEPYLTPGSDQVSQETLYEVAVDPTYRPPEPEPDPGPTVIDSLPSGDGSSYDYGASYGQTGQWGDMLAAGIVGLLVFIGGALLLGKR